MRDPRSLPRAPQVNLLRPPRRRRRLTAPRRSAELLLVVVAVLTWMTALVGIGMLTGWRPHLPLGP